MAIDLKNIDLKAINFKNIYEWPIMGRLIIFGLIAIGVFYLGYLFDFSSLSEQIYTRYRQEQDLKQQVKAILNTEESMKGIVSQYPEIVKLLNHWQGQLISTNHLPDLLNQILKLGSANHLQFILFAPGEKKQKDDYFMVPIKVIVQGDYSQVASFVSQVANLSQIVSVGDLRMFTKLGGENVQQLSQPEPVAVTHRLITEMILEVYYLANKK